jgi:hypothetical protein
VCGKLDNSIPYFNNTIHEKCSYIIEKNNVENSNFKPISTNGLVIYDGNSESDVDSYFFEVKTSNEKLLVLTDRERQLILKIATRYGVVIYVMEQIFPIFDDVIYNAVPALNFKSLCSKLKYLNTIGVKCTSISKEYSPKLRKIIGRKIRKKTTLDKFFFYSYNRPYQEVFKFSEKRDGRVIICLDYNSMYASCMGGDYIDPEHVLYESIKANYYGGELDSGLYRVVLSKPIDNEFRNYHPFKYTAINQSLDFTLESDHEIEVLLFDSEIKHYSKFFNETYIEEGLVSKSTIKHPLLKESKRLYKKRLEAKKKGKNALSRLYKYKLAMLHSITNPSIRKNKKIAKDEDIVSFLKNEFCLCVDDSNVYYYLAELKKSNHISIKKSAVGKAINMIDINNRSSIYSLSSQVTSNARLKLLKLIERLTKFDGLDLCYSNTDSVHVSIPKDRLDSFLLYMGDTISDNIGDLKIQGIGDQGYWFDVGRYYLFKGGVVAKFKNVILNHRGNKNPFVYARKIIYKYKNTNFNHTYEITKSIKSLTSYKKKITVKDDDLGNISYTRFNIKEISDYLNMQRVITNETIASQEIKIATYQKLANDFKNT